MATQLALLPLAGYGVVFLDTLWYAGWLGHCGMGSCRSTSMRWGGVICRSHSYPPLYAAGYMVGELMVDGPLSK